MEKAHPIAGSTFIKAVCVLSFLIFASLRCAPPNCEKAGVGFGDDKLIRAACSTRVTGAGTNQAPTNKPPVAVDDAAPTSQDESVAIPVLANDSDPDGDPISVSTLTQPANGAATINQDRINYTPKIDFEGVDLFTYTISDGKGGTATASVSVTVSRVSLNDLAYDIAIFDPNISTGILPRAEKFRLLVPTAHAQTETPFIYVTGTSERLGSGADGVTLKLDGSTGERIWTHRINGTANGTDECRRVVVDASGSVYVACVVVETGMAENIVVLKLNPTDGSEIWRATYHNSASADSLDFPSSLAIDPQGNVIVGGYSSGSGTGYDWVVLKFDPNGQALFPAIRRNGAINDNDFLQDIIADPTGNIYAAGTFRNSAPANLDPSHGDDWGLIKFDPAGKQLWRVEWDRAGLHDRIVTVRVAPDGNVIAFGHGGLAPETHLFVAKYKSDTGERLWMTTALSGDPSQGSEVIYAQDGILDASGDAYITGRWYARQPKAAESTAVSATLTLKVNGATGSQVWGDLRNSGGGGENSGVALAFDSSENLYVSGHITVGSDQWVLLKYNPAGALVWGTPASEGGGTANGQDRPTHGIVTDSLGTPYVGGYSENTGTGRDYTVIRYSPSDGSKTWLFLYR
ncbi:MAG: cadherin-like domain-containing protein [Deltaproteobacteria bacterium]|nr:cadherin-like domain-containing protein [Deltaproteobacteria bacterium]